MTESGVPGSHSPIANHVRACLIGLERVCTGLEAADETDKCKLSPWNVDDERGRFRLWCGNVAAHRKGRSSLDYKLREASHIQDTVVGLLKNLEKVIRKAYEIIEGNRIPWEELSDAESDLGSFGDSDEEDEKTEIRQLVSNMAEIITCLMRLSIAIRNPASHDQFKESSRIIMTHYERFDIEHVQSKFSHADEFLIIRLGKAISRRRQYLQYREEHRKKLGHGLEAQTFAGDDGARTVAPSENIQSTVASSIASGMKSSASAVDLDGDEYEDETLSQTSYASSFNDPTKLRPPPLPEPGQDGSPFECPLCLRLTTVRQGNKTWHRHVYRDLRPYICTFEDCEIPDCSYESRHEWFDHELHAHRKRWECIQGCNQLFDSSLEFRRHLRTAHLDLSSDNHFNDISRACERGPRPDTPCVCPLCQERMLTLKELCRHLGKHHEQLALFALPAHLKGDEEESNSDHEYSDSQSFGSAPDVQQTPVQIHGQSRNSELDEREKFRCSIVRDSFLQALPPLKTRPTQLSPTTASALRAEQTPLQDHAQSEKCERDISTIGLEQRMMENSQGLQDHAIVSNTHKHQASVFQKYDEVDEVVHFKDALGRTYQFPRRSVSNLEDLRKLIRQAILHNEELSPLAHSGQYDLIDSDGLVILNSKSKELIHPGATFTMRVWVKPELLPVPNFDTKDEELRVRVDDSALASMSDDIEGGDLRQVS